MTQPSHATGSRPVVKWLLYALTGLFVTVGGIGFLGPLFISPWVSSTFEMPLGHLMGIAVDSRGNVYCASQYYSRIQKYGPDGQFLLGWQIECGGGRFRIRMNEDDEIEVATARMDMFYRFSPKGELLQQKKVDPYCYRDFGSENDERCQGADGYTYAIRSRFGSPSVVRRAPSGERVKIVSTPLRKWIIMAPFPGWFFCMAGVAILIWLKRDMMIEKIAASFGGNRRAGLR